MASTNLLQDMGDKKMKKIELLSPAKNVECGIAAINHGADAIYIGASRFGARKSAGNSMADIGKLVDYGRKFAVDIYLTMNTILLDTELEEAEKTAREAVNAGVSALIIQDMAFLEMDLPPVRFFASTQTDNRTPEKVLFLEKAGFDRVILARELSIQEITKIRTSTTVDLESFVHGSACYSYSGRCYMSAHIGGRSANRGECGQPCRLGWDLKTLAGETLVKDRHLLSLKDMDRSDCLEDLVNAGISSFKIEGRLKDVDYVKNTTAFYRKKIDELIQKNHELRPSSSGRTFFFFDPDPSRTFNRGLHSFFPVEKDADSVFSLNTPKSLGKKIGEIRKACRDFIEIDASEKISNGDGLCFIDDAGILTGFQVEKAEATRIYTSSDVFRFVRKGMTIFRNRDHEFLKMLSSQKTSERKTGLDMIFYETSQGFGLSASDDDGFFSCVVLETEKIPADKPEVSVKNIEAQLSKLGDSMFYKNSFKIESSPCFIQLKALNQMRRALVAEMENARSALGCPDQDTTSQTAGTEQPRRFNDSEALECPGKYIGQKLDYSANVANRKAREFYSKNGVKEIDPACEISGDSPDRFLMYSRHCILKGTDLCLKNKESRDGFYIEHKNHRFRIIPDCKRCEMYINRLP